MREAGIRYERGQGVDQDYSRAYELYCVAALQGDSEAATSAFEELASATDAGLAARSRYNLGNIHYQRALEKLDKDKPGAIAELESAVARYRSALRIDPTD